MAEPIVIVDSQGRFGRDANVFILDAVADGDLGFDIGIERLLTHVLILIEEIRRQNLGAYGRPFWLFIVSRCVIIMQLSSNTSKFSADDSVSCHRIKH